MNEHKQEDDCRMEFLKDYTLSSMKLKKEKWKKIIVSDEQREYITNFIESDHPDTMVISQNAAGHLMIHIDWPSELKYKGEPSDHGNFQPIYSKCNSMLFLGVYFVKRDPLPLPEGDNVDWGDYLAWGDIHPNVLGTNIAKLSAQSIKARAKKQLIILNKYCKMEQINEYRIRYPTSCYIIFSLQITFVRG